MDFREILKRIIAEDKSILTRRDDFLSVLESAASSKDFQLMRRAVQSVNITEMFHANDGKDLKDKEDAIKSIRGKLAGIGLQEGRIDFIIDAFLYALDWDMSENEEMEEPAEEFIYGKAEEFAAETVAETPTVSLAKAETTLKEVWTCSCGHENYGNFCAQCGKKRNEIQEEPAEVVVTRNIENALEETAVPVTMPQTVNYNVAQTGVNQTLQAQPTYNQPMYVRQDYIDYTNSPNYEAGDMRKAYFAFRGRINRWAFFVVSVKLTLWYVLFAFIVGFIGSKSDAIGGTLLALGTIAMVLASLSIQIRRWHDLNRSGWWALVGFIPYVNFIVVKYLYLKEIIKIFYYMNIMNLQFLVIMNFYLKLIAIILLELI